MAIDWMVIFRYVIYLIAATLAVIGGHYGIVDPAVTSAVITAMLGLFVGEQIPSPTQNKEIQNLTDAIAAEKAETKTT